MKQQYTDAPIAERSDRRSEIGKVKRHAIYEGAMSETDRVIGAAV